MINIAKYFFRIEMYRCKYLFTVAFIVFFRFGFAQNQAFPAILKQNLENHVRFLASDSLQGRGFSGNINSLGIAADYLKKNVEMAGLKPFENKFSQDFTLIESVRDEENSFLKVSGKRKDKWVGSEEFAVINQKTEITAIEGAPVFLGFGIPDEEEKSAEFFLPDIRNKIAFVSSGTAESFLSGFTAYWDNHLEHKKAEKLFQAGAKAVILVTGIPDDEQKLFGQVAGWSNRSHYSLEQPREKQNRNLIVATPEAADAILGRKGQWKKLLEQAAKGNRPKTFATGNRILLKSVRKTKEISVQNVIGFLEGSDPVLKEECVVFMAHYDHLGSTDSGEIFNGADDNTSGTSTLLEVARALAQSGEQPRRSILFLWVTAEEVGMIGSEYYSKNPVFPLEKTAVCINLDMVGRVYEPRDSVWVHSPKQVKPFNEIYALVNDFDPDIKSIAEKAGLKTDIVPDFSLPDNFFYSSDHYHFHRNEIPILNLSTGYTADYHQPTDDIERINFDKMKKVAEFCYLIGLAVANK